MKISTFFLIAALLVYFVAIIFALKRWEHQRRMNVLIGDAGNKKGMKLMFYEHMFVDRFHLEPKRVRPVIYLERIAILLLIVVCLFYLRGLTVLVFGAVAATIFFDQATKNVIYESGITNVSNVVNFINFFVPHVSSGHSADQSLLGYIEYSKDEDLALFYEHKDDPEFVMQKHLRQIVDIYDIAKYNEEKGINDYTYILNEISQDYAQKQVYYNNFVARIGEIKPIQISYYVGVPILIIISLGQTYDFWMGIGGALCAIGVLLLFVVFKYLIYKLQKDTVTNIF